MRHQPKIVFCASEVFPFAKTGGLADVCGTLPPALGKLGADVSVVMPHYKGISPEKFGLKSVGPHLSYARLGEDSRIYFLRNDRYFNRSGLYGDTGGDYGDNIERFQFFCDGVLKVLKEIDLRPDVIHCHDWQTALVPVYLRYKHQDDPFYKRTKTVLSLHNLAYQGVFPREKFPVLDLPDALFVQAGFEFYGKVNLLKAGILHSDMVTTVSPTYAREIQTPAFGCGLDGVLHSRGGHVAGILNGIDYEVWDPRKDTLIVQAYGAGETDKKRANKPLLQKEAGLPARKDVPVFGSVGRLSHQKGIDLMMDAMADLLKQDIQVVILGIGEEKYHKALRDVAKRHPQRLGLFLTFEERLAHLVYAGSDFFLMPSIYEPCGLSQMISLKYGTVPVVFKTGGLADTVVPEENNGNGFVFDRYNKKDFIDAVRKAVSVFHDTARFAKLIQNAFDCNFSWESSARQYLSLYNSSLQGMK